MYDEHGEPTEWLREQWNAHNDHADDNDDTEELRCAGLRDYEAGTKYADCGSTDAHPIHYYTALR